MSYLWFRLRMLIRHRVLRLNGYGLRPDAWRAVVDITHELDWALLTAEELDADTQAALIMRAVLKAWKHNPKYEGNP